MHVSEGQLYAATVADFSGGEPLIHREKIRTERSDLNQLNGKLLEIGIRDVRNISQFYKFIRSAQTIFAIFNSVTRRAFNINLCVFK